VPVSGGESPLGYQYSGLKGKYRVKYRDGEIVAIRIGLILPASAVYFGHYAIAGRFVNLAAIPLAALRTPGALLVGLLDMIPLIGSWLALPVAWGVEVLSDIFLRIAATCAARLPYP
jgi:hypothetical protein